jgi:hypothetical protein
VSGTNFPTVASVPLALVIGAGNAAAADTNNMKVLAATNADWATKAAYTSTGLSGLLGVDSANNFSDKVELGFGIVFDGTTITLSNIDGSKIQPATITSNAISGTINAGQIYGMGTAASVNTNTLLTWAALQSATNFVFYPNGTNDQTAAIQRAAAVQFSRLTFAPGDYYVSHIYPTNNVTFAGYAQATLHKLAVAGDSIYRTNTDWFFNSIVIGMDAMIDCRSNTGCAFYGLNFDGNAPGTYGSGASLNPYTGVNNGFYTLQNCFTNVHGLLYNIANGGEVSGCTFSNFSGIGCISFSSKGQSGYAAKNGTVHHCEAVNSYCGFYIQSWGNNSPGLYDNAEYGIVSDVTASSCTVGVDAGASNCKVNNSTLNDNRVALAITAGNGNSGPHTTFENITMNHSWAGFWIGSCDYVGLNNIYQAATTTNFIKNGRVEFYNSSFAPMFIDGQGTIGTRGGVNFRNCTVGNFNIISNVVTFAACKVWPANPIYFTGSTVLDIANTSDGYTNWLTDVFTNAGNTGVFISTASQRNTTNGLPIYNGTFNGTGSGLTNLSAANFSNGGTSPSNNWVGAFTGNGSGLTNLNVISGSLVNPNILANTIIAHTQSGTYTVISNTIYFTYCGRAENNFVANYVCIPTWIGGSGTVSADVGIYYSTNPPNGAAINLFQLAVSTNLANLTTTTAMITNQTAFNLVLTNGAYIWAGFRASMSTQMSVSKFETDYGAGMLFSIAAGGKQDATNRFTASTFPSFNTGNSPYTYISH